jgi:hypothetical protein
MLYLSIHTSSTPLEDSMTLKKFPSPVRRMFFSTLLTS